MNNEELLNELLRVTLERRQLELNSILGGKADMIKFKDNKVGLSRKIEELKQDVLKRMK